MSMSFVLFHCVLCLFLFYLLPPLPSSLYVDFVCVCVVFDRCMFLMLFGCHVDILRGLACISHLCRSGYFVCLNYYGRPPVVISHFGGTFKMPLLVCHALLHWKDLSLGGGGFWVNFSQASVNLWIHWLIFNFFFYFQALSSKATCTYKTAYSYELHSTVCSANVLH